MEGKHLKIVFIIDESGSMSGTESDVIGGFNTLVNRQKLETEGKISITLYKFNDRITPIVRHLDIHEVQPLDIHNYIPGGSTALLDAIGNGIMEEDEYNNHPDTVKPDKVMMVIITDGYENSSRRYTKSDISTMIATHEKQLNWEFIYLGADLDSFSDADTIGLQYQSSVSKTELSRVFESISEESANYRKKKYGDDSKKMMEKIIEKTNKPKK